MFAIPMSSVDSWYTSVPPLGPGDVLSLLLDTQNCGIVVELEHSATETDRKDDAEGLGSVNVVGFEDVRLAAPRDIGVFSGIEDDCALACGSGKARHKRRSQTDSGNIPLPIAPYKVFAKAVQLVLEWTKKES